MSDHAHAVLVFYGGIVGFIVIILCLWCITHRRRVIIQEVPHILDEENVYTTVNNVHSSGEYNNM